MSTKEFGGKLKSARLETGLSQRSLGLSIGLSDKTISSYESSRSYPNLEILKKISEVLNKPVGYFLSSVTDEVRISDQLFKILQKQEELDKELGTLKELLKKVE